MTRGASESSPITAASTTICTFCFPTSLPPIRSAACKHAASTTHSPAARVPCTRPDNVSTEWTVAGSLRDRRRANHTTPRGAHEIPWTRSQMRRPRHTAMKHPALARWRAAKPGTASGQCGHTTARGGRLASLLPRRNNRALPGRTGRVPRTISVHSIINWHVRRAYIECEA
jgi:hypothetical protein